MSIFRIRASHVITMGMRAKDYEVEAEDYEEAIKLIEQEAVDPLEEEDFIKEIEPEPIYDIMWIRE